MNTHLRLSNTHVCIEKSGRISIELPDGHGCEANKVGDIISIDPLVLDPKDTEALRVWLNEHRGLVQRGKGDTERWEKP